ncbi:unnamed protein product, partial [Laminaria digitata]
DRVDVSDLPESDFTHRTEEIGVRWWFDTEMTIRETPYGPVISDAPLVPSAGEGVEIALRWMGHQPSDEITSMLRVSQADDFAEFRRALDGFHVPGQNMVFADAAGHIGQVMAVKLPARPTTPPSDVLVSPNGMDAWANPVTAADLPAAFDPPEGYVASANNKPANAEVAVGWHFSNDDRISRLRELLSGDGKIGVADLKALQRDVYLPSAVALRDLLLGQLQRSGVTLTLDKDAVANTLEDWDGQYDGGAQGGIA